MNSKTLNKIFDKGKFKITTHCPLAVFTEAGYEVHLKSNGYIKNTKNGERWHAKWLSTNVYEIHYDKRRTDNGNHYVSNDFKKTRGEKMRLEYIVREVSRSMPKNEKKNQPILMTGKAEFYKGRVPKNLNKKSYFRRLLNKLIFNERA